MMMLRNLNVSIFLDLDLLKSEVTPPALQALNMQNKESHSKFKFPKR